MDHEAKHWETLDNGKVRCLICPVRCKLDDGKEGVCMGRKNVSGRMVATNYGETVSVNIDPIEKKPLYHFHPGDPILSVGPNGCNLSCKNCQNWTISQTKQPTSYIAPDQLAEVSIARNCPGIAYTYTEPFIWFEYLLDAAQVAHDNDLYNVCVTNGYINAEPLGELLPFIDAVNVDVKSIRPEFYRRICKGNLDTVKNTVTACVEAGIHVELTNLLIPGLNDSDDDIRDLVSWISGLDRRIPFHISRYFPHHEMNIEATPMKSLKHAYDLAREWLDYVYVGNAEIEGASDTVCPQCGHTLISRSFYDVRIVGLEDNKCGRCKAIVPVVT